jgi:hypothetical protein
MGKRLATLLVVVAITLLLGVVYLGTRLRAEREIARAEMEAEFLRMQRDTILTIAAANDSLQRELSFQRAGMEAEADRLRGRITELEAARVEEQLTVRRLRQKEDLRARLEQTFPEMAASDWGVTEVFNEENGVGLEYLLVPLWFSETFLIDHQNSLAFQTQVDTLRALNGLLEQVSALQDSVLVLERGTRIAYERGYNEAYTRYEALNRDYIALLRQPRFSLGVPGGVGALAGSIGAGFLLGTVAR